jgi:hypothetical protein
VCEFGDSKNYGTTVGLMLAVGMRCEPFRALMRRRWVGDGECPERWMGGVVSVSDVSEGEKLSSLAFASFL